MLTNIIRSNDTEALNSSLESVRRDSISDIEYFTVKVVKFNIKEGKPPGYDSSARSVVIVQFILGFLRPAYYVNS